MGRPVKIIELIAPKSASSTPQEILFYEDELKSILGQLDCSDGMELSIISVTGPSHDGKSLFLSLLITSFRNHCRMTLETDLRELDFSQKNFEWNCTQDPHTSGIFLWSEPFVCKVCRPGKNNIVYFLMCVQEGKDITEDGRTSLIGLSSLISSRLYGNLIPELPEINTDLVKAFAPYKHYELLIDQTLEEPEDYVGSFSVQFSDTDEDKTQLALLETLRSFFKKAGERVIINAPLFKSGCLGTLSETPVKEIFGRKLQVQEMLDLIKSCISLFNKSGDQLSFDDIQQCNLDLSVSGTVFSALVIYDINMKDRLNKQNFLADSSLIKQHQDVLKLTKAHLKNQREVIKLFSVSDKAVTIIMEKHERELEYKLYLKFQNLWAINESQRELWVRNTRLEQVQFFRNPPVPRFRDKEAFHDETLLERICSREISSKVTSFRLKAAEYLEVDELKKETSQTENALKKELELLLNENKRRQDEAERKTLEMLNRNVLKLAKNIGSKSALEFVTQKMLQTKEEPKPNEAINQGLCCAICYEEKVSIAYPCGHVIGEKCHQMLQQKSVQNRNGFLCHQCRKPVSSTIKLYF